MVELKTHVDSLAISTEGCFHFRNRIFNIIDHAQRRRFRTLRRQNVDRAKPAHGKAVVSYQVGAMPIINRFIERMRLSEMLAKHLPDEDQRTKIDTPRAGLLLLRNLLVSREPVYGVAERASNFGPELLDLWAEDIEHLNDDRIGRCLDRVANLHLYRA